MSAKVDTMPVVYSVTDAALSELRQRLTGLTADTKEGYESVRLGIAECRELRTAVEKKRIELKADALAWGRKVDAEAKRITAALESVEEPLKIAKKAVDDEKDRIRREKEEAEKKRIEDELRAKREEEERKLRLDREAEEFRLKEERERLAEERRKLEAERAEDLAKQKVEQDRIAEEQRKERERLDLEKAKVDAEQAAERKRLDDERKAVEAERARIERIEFERQAEIRAEEAARVKIEREQAAAEMERIRLERLRPDAEKIQRFADVLHALQWPDVSSESALECVADVRATVSYAIQTLESFRKEVLV